MSYLDYAIGVLLIIGAFNGFRKGFIFSIFSLIALILGIIGAVLFPEYAEKAISIIFQLESRLVPILAFVVTFLVIMILVNLVGKLLEKVIDMLALTVFNKIAGMGFGIIKAALITGVILFIIEGIDSKIKFLPEEQKNKSVFYKPLLLLPQTIFPMLTDAQWLNDLLPESTEKSNKADITI